MKEEITEYTEGDRDEAMNRRLSFPCIPCIPWFICFPAIPFPLRPRINDTRLGPTTSTLPENPKFQGFGCATVFAKKTNF